MNDASDVGSDVAARWRRASDIVDAALDLDAASRERLVAERCADDAELAADVRRWLAAADEPASMFDAPPLPPGGLSPPRVGLTEGTHVGPWRVVRFVGAGGMGEVYEAERADGAFARRAALKIVRDSVDRARLSGRFRRERELLAGLDHPGIARLLDGGVTADGSPYYAMEFVDGVPIDAWCDARRLDVRGRVALLRQVCGAVRYAHQRLVVHRDLKPSNVLVTDDGVVKLVDFGIARPLADDALARDRADASGLATSRMLTPAYASPEQFRGEAPTVTSDVYSLAAVLYRLLAGRPPHGAARSWRDLERAVLETEPVRPSDAAPESHRRQLRGDLDTIALAGLRTDPARRYGSVEALDADLARWLGGLPVSARPDGWTYRAGKFVRRHRGGVALGALAIATLVGATVTAVVQARRAERETRRTAEVANFLLGLLDLPYPYEAGAGHDRSLRSLLDSGVARSYLVKPDPAGGTLRSDVLFALSRGYSGLGDFRMATRLAGQAMAQRIADHPDAYAVADMRSDYAETLSLAGDLSAALAQLDSALPVIRARVGPRSTAVAVFLHGRARALQRLGDLAGAESAAAQAIDILRDSAVHRAQLANAHETIGHVRLARGDIAGAEWHYRRALDVRVRSDLGAAEIANGYADLGATATAAGRLDEADTLFTRSLAIKRAALDDRHPDVADDLLGIARIALLRGRVDVAERGARDVLARYVAAGTVPFWRMVPALDVLGELLLRRGRVDSARAVLRTALDSLGRVTSFPTAQRASILGHLGETERARGDTAEARARGSTPVARSIACSARRARHGRRAASRGLDRVRLVRSCETSTKWGSSDPSRSRDPHSVLVSPLAPHSTLFTSAPIPSISIRTSSPLASVKSSGGTIPVPVSSTAPRGKLVSRNSHAASSSGVRRICASVVSPANTAAPPRAIRTAMRVSLPNGCSATSIAGPSAHEPSYTFACGRYSGFSPSMSRELTSLPAV
ncbi:protein kinase [Gemmatirosa kalamazoonensis]|uniref:Protein kinase n=1 Tax=Gemmatirosa kalamazoonensis TaxID=861299 RepID=W0RJS8_9BACT|nr:protein kinase [Gemmatirosa kalamazoonensis]